MVGVWEGLNLGSIPNVHMPSQKDPKISIERRCSTILPWVFWLEGAVEEEKRILHKAKGDLSVDGLEVEVDDRVLSSKGWVVVFNQEDWLWSWKIPDDWTELNAWPKWRPHSISASLHQDNVPLPMFSLSPCFPISNRDFHCFFQGPLRIDLDHFGSEHCDLVLP